MSRIERGRRSGGRRVETLSLFAWAKTQQNDSPPPPPHTALLAPSMPLGLQPLDRALGGGLPRGSLTLLAARSGEGATSLAFTALLQALNSGTVATFASNRLQQPLVRQRLLTLEAKSNFFGAAAHILSDAQREALRQAEKRLAWSHLHLLRGTRLHCSYLHEHLCANPSALCVIDVPFKTLASQPGEPNFVLGSLLNLARTHQTALLLRHRLRGYGRVDEGSKVWPFDESSRAYFSNMVVLERCRSVAGAAPMPVEGQSCEHSDNARTAVFHVLRARGKDVVPAPCVRLGFDQRYFGYTELEHP